MAEETENEPDWQVGPVKTKNSRVKEEWPRPTEVKQKSRKGGLCKKTRGPGGQEEVSTVQMRSRRSWMVKIYTEEVLTVRSRERRSERLGWNQRWS